MKKLFTLSLVLFACFGMAQNQLGLHQGNFNGATGILKNPASFQLSSQAWDFVIVSGGAFVENDYAYFKSATIPQILFGGNDFVEAGEMNGKASTHQLEYDFFDASKPMYNTVNGFAGYPSFVGRINRTISVGLFSRTRVAFAANQIDEFWSMPKLDQWSYGEVRVSDPIWVGAMAWSEVGLNLSKALKIGNNPLAIGVNLKYLAGHESVYGFVPNQTEVSLFQPYYLANTQEAYFGFTDFENELLEPAMKGSGFGVDIGFVLVEPGEEGNKWQASFSIIDLGAIRFTNAQHHHLTATQISVLSRPAMAAIQGLDEFARTVSNEVMGSPTASYVGSSYNVLTPAGIIAGFEYQVSPKVYLEIEAGRRLVLSPRQVFRENYLAVSGRYETPWFEVGVPLVLYNDEHFRMGTWVRVGPLVVGSDHIATWFIKQRQLTGTDFYFALRINELTFASSKSRKRRTPEDCYW